ncbi:MAG: NFACT family protein [Lachnospiraceae bacterium]|jgi:predicted ribosome quality control (RQC) complex YloA/Tae2 family protein|nr:NFACT family protein [Lachnospiraceae bacterium]
MAFDGVTCACVVQQLKKELIGSRIQKIAQPEPYELLVQCRSQSGQSKVLLSANPTLPLVHLTRQNKNSPLVAPNFCMVLRKHIQGGRITEIYQEGLERIIHFVVEHYDEMGDLCHKELIIEIMGKHSNIILINQDKTILDSIKHINAMVSSVREILPGRTYVSPPTQDKADLISLTREDCLRRLETTTSEQTIQSFVYQQYTGLSPVIGREVCFEAMCKGDTLCATLDAEQKNALYTALTRLKERVEKGEYTPQIVFDQSMEPKEYAVVQLLMFSSEEYQTKQYDDISILLDDYYEQRRAFASIRQKSADIRHLVQSLRDKNIKKRELYQQKMSDTEDRDRYRVYGELLHTYPNQEAPQQTSVTLPNYYTGEDLTIPLDPMLSFSENAKRYFAKYNKMKRTAQALLELQKETDEEIYHLESILTSLDITADESDLLPIKNELIEAGYMKRKGNKAKNPTNHKKKSESTAKIGTPIHYQTSDGYDLYVGKNNYQNDELTFSFATGNDWWFHAKGIPGSHVIVKSKGGAQIPDRVFEEAAKLAAYYSKGRGSHKVEVDYIQKKHVKKPNHAKPGFVVYYTNYSLLTDSDISHLTLITNGS